LQAAAGRGNRTLTRPRATQVLCICPAPVFTVRMVPHRLARSLQSVKGDARSLIRLALLQSARPNRWSGATWDLARIWPDAVRDRPGPSSHRRPESLTNMGRVGNHSRANNGAHEAIAHDAAPQAPTRCSTELNLTSAELLHLVERTLPYVGPPIMLALRPDDAEASEVARPMNLLS
jgi:hypothetical protein